MISEIFHQEYGENKDASKPILIWGHGWGQDHHAFDVLIQTLSPFAHHIALDFPGFGKSAQPEEIWGIKEYANVTQDFIAGIKAKYPAQKIFWAGHSFGGRVALQLGAQTSDLLDGMIIIAGAGLKPQRSLLKSLQLWLKVRTFKFFKVLTKFGVSKDWVIKNFTGGDYKNAGAMRRIFVKIVNEDLSAEARKCAYPALLLYAQDDTAAPPDIGQRLAIFIPDNHYHLLQGFDHYSILTSGRHVVAKHIQDFLNGTPKD